MTTVMNAHVQIECPICGAKSDLDVPPDLVGKKHITTMFVPRNYLCPHGFQVFIDTNMKVRGYQRIDFELTSNKQVEFGDSRTETKEQELPIHYLIEILGSHILVYLLRALITGATVYFTNMPPPIFESITRIINTIHAPIPPHFIMADKEILSNLGEKKVLIVDYHSHICPSIPFYESKFNEERELIAKMLNANSNHQKIVYLQDFFEIVMRLISVLEQLPEESYGNLKQIQKFVTDKIKNVPVSKDLVQVAIEALANLSGKVVYEVQPPFSEKIKSLLDDF